MNRMRNSNIELLRIVGMFLIIIGHFAWHTRWSLANSDLVMKSSIDSLWVGGKLGVNIFVLISGYFLIKSSFKKKSFIRVWLVAYFYTIVAYLMSLIFGLDTFNIKTLFKVIFLVGAGKLNWFVTAYLIMYLLSPFINTLLLHLTKDRFQVLLGIFFGISILKTIFHNPSIGTTGNDEVWLVMVYCFGAYIRIFQNDLKKISRKIFIGLLALSLFLSIASVFILNTIQYKFEIKNNVYFYSRLLDGFSPLQLISACLIFILVLDTKPFTSQIVNKVASTTFAVYLIHANLLVVNWLWNKVVSGYRFENSPFVFIYALGVTFLVFSICSVIDLIRQRLLGVVEFKLIGWISKIRIIGR